MRKNRGSDSLSMAHVEPDHTSLAERIVALLKHHAVVGAGTHRDRIRATISLVGFCSSPTLASR